MRQRFPLAALLLFLSSCPAPTKGPAHPEPPPIPAGLSTYRALELVPPGASYVVAVGRVATLAEALRGLVDPLRILDTSLTADRIDQDYRQSLGLSPLQATDLDDAGLDLSGDVAVFSTTTSPTLAVRIADEGRLNKFLAERTKRITTYIKPYKGQVLTSWVYAPDVRGTFLRLGGYLIVHLELLAEPMEAKPGADGAPAENNVWLDEVLAVRDSRRSVLGSDDLRWALQATAERDALVLVDPPRLARSLRLLTAKSAATCGPLHDELARLKRIGAGLRLQKRQLRAVLTVDLAPEALADLRKQAVGGPTLPGALYDGAPARVAWYIQPLYPSELISRHGKAGCGPVARGVSEWGASLRELTRRNETLLGYLSGGLAAALYDSDERGQGTVHLRAALVAGCGLDAARAFFLKQLPVAAEGKETLAGQEVRKVAPETMLTEKVRLAIGDGLLRLTIGEGLMDRLLAKPRPAAPGRLLSFRIEPGRLADLRAGLKLLDEKAPPPSPWGHGYGRRSRADELDRLANLVSSAAVLALDASLAASVLRVELEYQLR